MSEGERENTRTDGLCQAYEAALRRILVASMARKRLAVKRMPMVMMTVEFATRTHVRKETQQELFHMLLQRLLDVEVRVLCCRILR